MRRRLLAPFAFHIDVCLGGKFLAGALEETHLLPGERVRTHTSEFPQATPDEVWLPSVASEWVVLSADGAMLSKEVERTKVVTHSMAMVFYPRDLSRTKSVELVAASLPRIRGLLGARSLPFSAHVNPNGKVTVRKL